eukprot:scaffold43545_cov51-Prasinocladus_malaysianus.AAC.1
MHHFSSDVAIIYSAMASQKCRSFGIGHQVSHLVLGLLETYKQFANHRVSIPQNVNSTQSAIFI